MSLTKTLMTRLSPNFILLDFVYGRDIYAMKEVGVLDTITPENLEMGELLCNELIEPLIDLYGPVSVAAGFSPTSGHTDMHAWTRTGGIAADLVFHDWVNADRPPIGLCADLDVSHPEIVFDRLISYATSEFLCVGRRAEENRYAIHENILLPEGHEVDGKRSLFSSWGYARDKRKRWPSRPKSFRDHWRRAKDQAGPHTSRSIRAQHVRLGRYFTLLDFCHSPYALAAKRLHVPYIANDTEIEHHPAARVGRMFAEVLEPIAKVLGHVSVVRGFEPSGICADVHAPEHHWTGRRARLVFAMPSDLPGEVLQVVAASINAHPALRGVETRDIGSSQLIAVTIEPFKVKENWHAYAS